MKKFYIILSIGFSLYSCVCHQVNLEAFTHPYTLDDIPVYSKPDKFLSLLQADDEAGWIVKIRKQKYDYFYVNLPEDCDSFKKNIWIKAGDLGIVIQNVDSLQVPMYESADTLSNSIAFVYNSTIGKIFDLKDELVLLGVRFDNIYTYGWVEKKYLCGNPYTTCN